MKRFAVFDIDGTLIRWQLYHAVANSLARQGHLGEDAYDRLRDARMVWKERRNENAFSHYERLLVDTFELALPRIKSADFDFVVEQVIDEYKNQVYTYTRDLIVDLKQKGYFLLAISGSHQELVEKLAEHYGFDDVVGTRYERKGQKFSGESFIASHDKLSVLNELIAKYNLSTVDSIAVGDTKSDAPLLHAVENPIAFNPDRKLYAYARQQRWPIVIERKSVIYTLNSQDGHYTLD